MVSTAGTMLAMSSTKSSRPDSTTSLTQALVKSRTNGSHRLMAAGDFCLSVASTTRTAASPHGYASDATVCAQLTIA